MQADRDLDEYAARQYGTFSRAQAVTVGMTPKMVHTRLAAGAWIRMAPSVYAVASAPPKWERQMAAALLTRTGSIVAGRSAAFVHGFSDFGGTRPVIMIGPSGNSRSQLAHVIRSQRFDAVGRVRRRGFVVTDEAETVMTLAGELTLERLEALIDSRLAAKTLAVSEVAHVVDLSGGLRGIAKLRGIVDHRSVDAYQPPTSELERLLYRLLDNPRLPEYSRQIPIRYQQSRATVDAFLDPWNLIVEGDGRRWHTRRADFDRDRLRDNEAAAHGLVVIRFTYEMLRDEVERCLDTLIRTGRVRSTS